MVFTPTTWSSTPTPLTFWTPPPPSSAIALASIVASSRSFATSTDSTTLFKHSLPSSSLTFSRNRTLIVKASSSSSDHFSRSWRCFIAETAIISVSLPQFFAARAKDTLFEWERVCLPIEPGVVLLNIAFVPDDSDHGFLLGMRQTILETKDGGNIWAPHLIPSVEDEDFNYRFNSISFKGKEGWIIGKHVILLYTSDAREETILLYT